MAPSSITQLETELSSLKARLANAPNVAEAAQRALDKPETLNVFILALAERETAAGLPPRIAELEQRLLAARKAAIEQSLRDEFLALLAKKAELAARLRPLYRNVAIAEAQANQARSDPSNAARARERVIAANRELFPVANAYGEASRELSDCLARVKNLIGDPWKDKSWAELFRKSRLDQPKVTVAEQIRMAAPNIGATPDLSELPLAEQIARLQPTWDSEP
jgi:chromosome segregation ATPase